MMLFTFLVVVLIFILLIYYYCVRKKYKSFDNYYEKKKIFVIFLVHSLLEVLPISSSLHINFLCKKLQIQKKVVHSISCPMNFISSISSIFFVFSAKPYWNNSIKISSIYDFMFVYFHDLNIFFVSSIFSILGFLTTRIILKHRDRKILLKCANIFSIVSSLIVLYLCMNDNFIFNYSFTMFHGIILGFFSVFPLIFPGTSRMFTILLLGKLLHIQSTDLLLYNCTSYFIISSFSLFLNIKKNFKFLLSKKINMPEYLILILSGLIGFFIIAYFYDSIYFWIIVSLYRLTVIPFLLQKEIV